VSAVPVGDRGGTRLLQYLALALLLVTGAALLPGPTTRVDPWVHTVVEALATALALVVGTLALILFRARGRSTYLFIGTGFLAASLLDGWHALVSSPLVAPRLPTPGDDLAAWSWLAGRFFLALFLLSAWWVRERRGEAGDVERPSFRKPPEARSLFLTAGGLVVVLFAFLLFVPLPPAVRPDALLPRAGELVPGVLFGAVLAGILRQGGWRRDPFEHALVLFLALSTFLQFGYVLFSAHPFDLLSLVGRLLKAGSYAVAAGGLLLSVDRVFRRDRRAQAAMAEANAALSREITSRREYQERSRESEERLSDFLDHAHDLIHSVDPRGRILYVNEAWKRRLGYADHEIRAMRLREIVHADSLETFDAATRRILAGEPMSDVQITLVASDGSLVVLSGSSNCRFEDGEPVATRTILRDISGERARDDALARIEANLRGVFESTGDPIWSVDRDGQLVTFNTAYALLVEVITGHTPRAGEPTFAFMSDEASAWYRGCHERALRGSRFTATREEDVDGQPRFFDLFFNPIESADGGITGVVVFARDATRRHRVEEALRRAKREADEANETKSHFLASMSHELRTPLNSIIGFSNILLRGHADALPERERGFLDRIQANGKHLLHLINEILDLSKIEAGRMELQLEPVELATLVEETVQQLEAQVSGRPVALRWEVHGTPGPIETDPARLRQVLINLIGNALKFTESGSVTVHLDTGADGITPERIRVRDTGIGIPEDRLDAIFQAFEQAEAGTSRRFGGTGLGLAISRSLCRLMGFDLVVRSEVGEGSEFSIALNPGTARPGPRRIPAELAGTPDGDPGPGRTPPDPPPAPPTPSAAPRDGPFATPPDFRVRPASVDPETLRGRTILVVDDEPDSRELLRHMLEELGCRVVTAGDGIEGLAVARRESPDLITLDLMMPRMNGWEMLRALRDDPEVREVPVVIVSLLAEDGSGQVLGAVDLLQKPVDRDALARAVRRNLTRAGARVLVVDDDPDARSVLSRYLEDAGFAVQAAEHGLEALRYLKRVPVELVITDLSMPVMDGITLLGRMRASPDLALIPVLVLTGRDVTAAEREVLDRAGVPVLRKAGAVEEELRRALVAVAERAGFRAD
jgi:PAS domain S-box-containing protein